MGAVAFLTTDHTALGARPKYPTIGRLFRNISGAPAAFSYEKSTIHII